MSDRSRDARPTTRGPLGKGLHGIDRAPVSSQAGFPVEGSLPGTDEFLLEQVQRVRAEDAVLRKVGRNDLCPCGSGRKYKKCCIGKHQQALAGVDPEETRRRAKRERENARRDERVREGYDLMTRGEHAAARDFASRWSETYPQDDRFHDILVTSCLHLGDFDSAEEISEARWKAALVEKDFFLSSGNHSYDDPDVPPGHAYGPEAWMERLWVARKARTYSVSSPRNPDPVIVRLIRDIQKADDLSRFPQQREEGLRVRREALAVPLQGLKDAGPQTLPYLMPLCVRYGWTALLIPEILIQWRDDASIRALVELAIFHYPFLSESCLKGLEELGEGVLPHLKEAFRQDEEFDSLKIGLISVAGQIGTPETLDWVTALLDHSSPTVVNWAAGVLGKRGHLPALEKLRQAAARVGQQPNIVWAIDELENRTGKG